MATTTPVTITVGNLPNPFCPATEQARLDGYMNACSWTVPSGYSQWIVSNSTPGSGDREKIWLRTDTNGDPMEALIWSKVNSTWVRWFSTTKYPVTSTGAANAYVLTFNPTKLSYKTGEVIVFLAGVTNTGAATLKIDGLAATPIKKFGSAALAANDILNGQVVMVVYDGTNFELLNSPSSLSVPPVLPTKFASGLFSLPAQGSSLTIPHTLGYVPTTIQVWLRCKVADNDWSVGDFVSPEAFIEDDAGGTETSSGTTSFHWLASTTVLQIFHKSCSAPLFKVCNKTTGLYAATSTDPANWEIFCVLVYVP